MDLQRCRRHPLKKLEASVGYFFETLNSEVTRPIFLLSSELSGIVAVGFVDWFE